VGGRWPGNKRGKGQCSRGKTRLDDSEGLLVTKVTDIEIVTLSQPASQPQATRTEGVNCGQDSRDSWNL